MKKTYEKPEFETIEIENKDIITSSWTNLTNEQKYDIYLLALKADSTLDYLPYDKWVASSWFTRDWTVYLK